MKKLSHSQFCCYCLITICIAFSVTGFAQTKKSSILKYDHAASPGKMLLADGTELEGEIVFNDNDGIVTVYQGDNSQSFNSRSLARFEFFDSEADRLRLFYSLEFNDPETGLKDTEIFEVLKELDSFVVLAKIDRIKTEARKGLLSPPGSPLMVDRKSKKFTQTQTVYFMNGNGEFQPFLRIVEKEIGGDLLDYNETNNRFINGDLFKEYTGSHFAALSDFAKQNKLSFKRKTDIIRILDEYERLKTQIRNGEVDPGKDEKDR